MRRPLGIPILSLSLALAALPLVMSPATASGAAASCPGQSRIDVPGAEKQETACLDDLTTAGTVASGHTNVDDWAGLHAAGTTNPTGVPGIQVDGYFPDTSTSNTNNGWNHDSQFVIRLPTVERKARDHRGARHPPPVRQRLHHRRLGARAGLRVRLDRQGQQRGRLLRRRLVPGRLDPRVEPAGHPADPGHQAGRGTALRPRTAPYLHVRDLQRGLPDPLAAREPGGAVRRRPGLGGHAVPRGRTEPAHLSADRAPELPGVRDR